MKIYQTRIVLALAIMILALQAASGQTTRQRVLTAREIAQKTLPSVVLLVTEDSSGNPKSLGSGFFVQGDVIATNYHVVEGASKIKAKIVGSKTTSAVDFIIGKDKDKDLALLKVSGVKAKPLSFGDADKVAVGDVVYAVGNPEGFEGTFSQGIVSGIRQLDGQRYIQITAPVSHGSSGGPVLNKNGEVIGIAVASLEEGQNLNFAIPIFYLSTLISRMRPDIATTPQQEITFREEDIDQTATASNYYKDGEALMRQSRYSEALEASKTAIRYKPDYYEAYVLQGRAYSLLKRDSEAIQAYLKAIDINSNQSDAYFYLGMSYSNIGYYDKAIAAHKDALRISPTDYEPYKEIGNAYYQLGHYQDAVDAYKQVIRLNPDMIYAHRRLGDCYFYLNQFQNAIFALKQAISLAKNDRTAKWIAETHYNIGLAYINLREVNSASEEYKTLKTLDEEIANKLFEQLNKNWQEDNDRKQKELSEKKEKTYDAFDKVILEYHSSDPNWTYLGESKSDFIFYNSKSSTSHEKKVTVWIKLVAKAAERDRIEQEKLGKLKKESFSTTLFECDCSNKKVRLLSTISYDDDRNSLYSNDSPAHWTYFPPDTAFNALFDKVCPKKK